MAKRIVVLPHKEQPVPAEPAAAGPFEPGKDRRLRPRRSGLPRRIQVERRNRGTADALLDGKQRVGPRRTLSNRRRHRDRRFGLDPTLYDRLGDLNL
ncbi:MAG: hypothetical protein ACRD00_03485 [Thermoanaerobaculia bacterium]